MSELTEKDHIEMDEKKQKDLLVDFLVERNVYLAFFQELKRQNAMRTFENEIKKGNISSIIDSSIAWGLAEEPAIWSDIHDEWYFYSRFILYNIKP